MTVLAGLFLVVHGLLHVGVWAVRFDTGDTGFDPRRSWLLERIGTGAAAPGIAAGLAVAAAGAFVLAGVGVLAGASWAPPLAIAAAAVSLVLTVATYHRWLTVNLLIDVAIIAIAA